MKYQSFLSSILQNKYYTLCKYNSMLEEINELSFTIQRNTGRKIHSMKLPEDQIFLTCSNRQFCECEFSHRFKKAKVVNGFQKFELVQSIEKHSKGCYEFVQNKRQQQMSNIQQNQIKDEKIRQSAYLQSVLETSLNSPASKQQIINNVKSNAITSNLQNKIYTEDQFSLLKKELQLQSKGLLSKSTEFEDSTNYSKIKKIQFHCKIESSCPYLATLTFWEPKSPKYLETQKRSYSLQIHNPNHLTECILENQVINYNKNTMKIDLQIELLTKIIQENSQKLKPKVSSSLFQQIMKKLADEMEEEENFIYEGLSKKMNKRAIKKYFDNCVAKIRSRVFPCLKNSKISLTYYESSSKKDEDYICK